MIYKVVNCTQDAVTAVEKIESEDSYILVDNLEYRKNEYGLFPFVVDGNIVRYKTAEELATEAAEREAAQQIAQPTESDRLDAIEAAILDIAEMLLGGADNG